MDAVSQDGDPHAFQTPHPHVDRSPYDFSFSGLKTYVINTVHHMEQKGEKPNVPDMGATIITAVVDSLADNTERAAKDLGYDTIVLAGGVSANSFLRKRFETICENNHWTLYMPELQYCGDNGAMVAAQGYYEFIAGRRAGLDLNAKATMAIDAEF